MACTASSKRNFRATGDRVLRSSAWKAESVVEDREKPKKKKKKRYKNSKNQRSRSAVRKEKGGKIESQRERERNTEGSGVKDLKTGPLQTYTHTRER